MARHAETCKLDGCDHLVTLKGARGWCPRHYQRWLRTGEPEKLCVTCGAPSGLRKYCTDSCKPRCSVAGCDEPARKRGWCGSHYAQHQATGRPPEPFQFKWHSDDVGYGAVHDRMRRRKGSASRHACAHGCGRPALQWAYAHTDPDEKTSDYGHYSLDPEHYIPLCASCHKRFDLAHAQLQPDHEGRQGISSLVEGVI